MFRCMTNFDVKCPKCQKHAIAGMAEGGQKGTYREVLTKLVAANISCKHCGYLNSSETPINYELWYSTNYRGHHLWVNNRDHALFLAAYLLGEDLQISLADKSWLETLPRWMILKNNRAGVARKLMQMLEKD